ncbi:MAG: hypothetical protein COV08_01675 [Candidatus Vogelbacteria bacterium CG10_big_fil_rev_8_21_14_0_10_49_38]|uniref:Methyltransferase FkbM domain-containing protein n=1 Tax=Candidatus Vogelbacteria bacterium CG10_big_fil_rev_8_21_14_0_10_49_38 TaxID=1975043 RepID=A0A2H0RI30_9BACT|nr:MAG: hypothetical protein BK006_01690 [bacterium CG10_49_38]PIR46107.1 MAG: hypothetical protein COV08_01675 [Candidatus Vogelbacteria bacterium CG10_big_fil_rev_8_21_14_0_10_49_38]
MINRKDVQKAIRLITPPLIIAAYKKSPLYQTANAFFNKPTKDKIPSWHTIVSGDLAGLKIFANNTGGFREMINGSYDKFFFDYVKKFDLTGKTVYDIGSHVGFTALQFAKVIGPEGKVIAFEPNEFNARRFKYILSENGDLAGRIDIHEIAISQSQGSEDFLFGDDVDGGTSSGSFIDRSHTFWKKEVYEEQIGFVRKTIQTLPLDLLESELLITKAPALIKIDVEGAEQLVLEGGRDLIKKNKPILLIEIHSIFSMFEVGRILNELEYTTSLLKEESDGRCFIAAHPLIKNT